VNFVNILLLLYPVMNTKNKQPVQKA